MEITLGPAKPIVGTFEVPGDKSISHRALLLASLADGVSLLHNLLQSGDTHSTMDCLRALGIEIMPKGQVTEVRGRGLNGFKCPTVPLHAGNSGTTMRLLSGLLAGQSFETTITGDDSLKKRPMQRVIDPLTLMGARVLSDSGNPPLTIHGRYPLTPITYILPFPSAQVKSAVLLAGLFADGATTIIERVVTRDHTERMLNLVSHPGKDGRSVTIAGGTRIPPRDVYIPGDISSAIFLISAAALVPGSDVRIRNVGLNTTRTAVLDVLVGAGLAIHVEDKSTRSGEDSGTIHVRFTPASRPIELNAVQVPWMIDEIPALAVVAALSGVDFSVAGAGELRVKESDRIRLLVKNLRAIGVNASEERDGFSFEGPGTITPCLVQSGGDHRIAMAFALAGLGGPGEIRIEDAHVSDISYPGFWDILKSFQ